MALVSCGCFHLSGHLLAMAASKHFLWSYLHLSNFTKEKMGRTVRTSSCHLYECVRLLDKGE